MAQILGTHMPRKQESKRKLRGLSDADISAAIRYLDPDAVVASNRDGLSAGFVICISVLVLILGCVALLWIHRIVAN